LTKYCFGKTRNVGFRRAVKQLLLILFFTVTTLKEQSIVE